MSAQAITLFHAPGMNFFSSFLMIFFCFVLFFRRTTHSVRERVVGVVGGGGGGVRGESTDLKMKQSGIHQDGT